jgi:hypothetical protein
MGKLVLSGVALALLAACGSRQPAPVVVVPPAPVVTQAPAASSGPAVVQNVSAIRAGMGRIESMAPATASAGGTAPAMHRLNIRMDDGSMQVVDTPSTGLAIGDRVELEEVERAVLATGLVGTAVVEKVAGAYPHLVCFYVPRSGMTSADAHELPTQLSADVAERLPGYMIPARWVALAELPFTSNGKVDRARLLASL